MSIIRLRSVMAASLVAAICLAAQAEEKSAGAGSVPTEQVVDRDGKPICGIELMTSQEINGYRSLLFFAKTLADRDAIREEHCKAMRKRANERATKLTG